MLEKTKIMQKYLYFRSHHEHHKQAANLAAKLMMKDSSEKYKFVNDALSHVVQCRKILQWTYALAYFLKQSGGKVLFEMQQQMLNNFTEELQEILENEKNPETFLANDFRHKIISKSNLIADYAEKTIKSIEDGDLVSLLMYEADSFTSGWTCTACQHTHEEKLATKDKDKDSKDKSKAASSSSSSSTTPVVAPTATPVAVAVPVATAGKKKRKREKGSKTVGVPIL